MSEGQCTWKIFLSFSPRPRVKIVGVTTLRWQTVKAKISTSPSPVELVRHSSYDSSALPEIFPSAPQIFCWPLATIFPFLFLLFFLPRLLTNQLKNQKLQKKNALPKFLEWHLDF